MKRLGVSLVILALIAAICIVGIIFIQIRYEEVDKLLVQCEDFMEQDDWKSAARCANTAEKVWMKSEKGLSVFINHDLIDEVGLCIASISPYATPDTKQDFFAACKTAKTALLHMKNDQIISFETLF
jgi:hypothetical protein